MSNSLGFLTNLHSVKFLICPPVLQKRLCGPSFFSYHSLHCLGCQEQLWKHIITQLDCQLLLERLYSGKDGECVRCLTVSWVKAVM